MLTTRLEFLTQLPVLLNSSLDAREVIGRSINLLCSELHAEAATVFMVQPDTKELVFWSLEGGDSAKLRDKKIPSGVGIVGWVVDRRESLLVPDAAHDPRFFKSVDQESSFITKSVICVPLIARGNQLIGALEVLNKCNGGAFTPDELEFVERFSHQAALAIENASLYEQARLLNQQLAMLNRRKEEILSLLSHEVRTPVNILQNSAELLVEANLDAAQREAVLGAFYRGVDRLLTLVKQIKEISSTAADELEIQVTNVSLTDSFEDIKRHFVPIFERRNLAFSIDVPVDSISVKADRLLLLVVLKNLLSNAVRFTPDQGSIRLSATRHMGRVTVSVADTGIGIDQEHIPLIFEKFYEVTDILHHSSGSYEFMSSGLGLGLSAVKTILQAHGTAIDLQTELGKGSTFSFSLTPA